MTCCRASAGAPGFAAALRGEPADERTEKLVASRLVFSAPLDPERLRTAIASALDGGCP